MLVCAVSEGNFEPIEPCFDLVFSHADVYFGTRNLGFVYNAVCKAGTFQRAFVFSSAVASLGACVVISAKDLHVVGLDNSFHIRHITVAHFRSIPIEQLMERMAVWEVLVD